MTREDTRIAVRRAGIEDLDALAPLFDAYRQFYRLPADLALSREYLRARLAHGEAAILLAQGDNAPPAGFCLLYPSWCSLDAAPILVLNDLYVVPHARRAGVGAQLLQMAETHARQAGASRMELSTARTNATAQSLYESLGWRRDDVYLTCGLDLTGH
jgi:ribosomal protein S18 acetylase RimI-like enzyme